MQNENLCDIINKVFILNFAQGGMIMSRVCSICGKGPVAGNSRSHALNISKRVFRPNLRRTKLEIDGKVETAYVCTKCLKGSKKDK